MKITKIHIEKFRGFQNEDFELGTQLTAIAGQNGTQKSTLLGIVTQTFALKEGDPMRAEKPLCGGNYISSFKDKFRLSSSFDKPKDHEWTISFDDNTDFTVESIKRSGDPNVRFWKKGARKEGDGYIPLPTIFLSLKRLVPAAEESKIKTNDALLTKEESEIFKQLHNKILITQIPISSATAITSKNKQSLGVSTALYDWNQNSMGQDNLGKIILALFSFKRLKDNYPKQYKGGILAIDEMDATMYPASQVELLKVLRQYASKLNLQILFTTHSMSLLRAMDDLVNEVNQQPQTANQVKIVYLKRVDNKIEIKQDTDFNSIQLDLNVVAEGNKCKKNKITVYTEDKETILLTRSILKSKAGILNFVNATLPCSMLINLVDKKIPAFTYPYSIVILDGDVRLNRTYLKKIEKTNNVLILPGSSSPERSIAKFLNELPDADSLWGKIATGYTKQVCFRTYSFDQIHAEGEEGRQNAKKWFNEQLQQYWGRGGAKILTPFCNSIKQDCDTFKSGFENMIKRYIHD